MPTNEKFDFALVGAGIMSATLASFIKLANPRSKIIVFERLDHVGGESSDAWNNAGTGHAALCELNYMPDSKDGSLPDPAKAIQINEQFQLSRQFWAHLVREGVLGEPKTFINSTPHMTFVRGAKDVDYLKRRHKALKDQPLFAGLQYSEDLKTIGKWAPLIAEGREKGEYAATYIEQGTESISHFSQTLTALSFMSFESSESGKYTVVTH